MEPSASGDAPAGAPRNAPPAPTPEQWAHLGQIRAQLSVTECAIAENAMMRMGADTLAHWLAELSAQSVDDAVRTLRALIEQLRRERAGTGEGG